MILTVAVCVHLGHQAAYRSWVIEDAAICFAFARNIVEGEGVVARPGGERVEGISNPTWVALLVLWQAFGVDGWTSAKVMAAVFGAATLPLAHRLARDALPEAGRGGALLAPVLLAGSAHHAIWSASALENSLFSFLLMLGAGLVLREDRRAAAPPVSAAVFCALALTRPEGVLYALVAGFWVLGFTWARGEGVRRAAAWAVVFGTPYALFEAWRIWYFAWPLPMTYYAKMGDVDQPWLHWHGRGWSQLRAYAQSSSTALFLPLLPVALLGPSGWRGRLGLTVVVTLGLALLLPGPLVWRAQWLWPTLSEPSAWLAARIVLIGVVGTALPFAAWRNGPGWRARVLVWHLGAVAVFFSVYSDGDWMRGLRWMSLFAPAQAILLAVGLTEARMGWGRWSPGRLGSSFGWTATALAIMGWWVFNLSYSRSYSAQKDDWPHLIKRRADHTAWFARRVFLDETVRTLDMDMGAHLWWTDQHMVDMAGLTDVPIALHGYRSRDFIQEYVFDEQRPHFAHVHLRWAEQSNLKSYPGWDETFFALQGYPDGPHVHGGMYARRDLVMQTGWTHPVDRAVSFDGGVQLEGFDLPSPEGGAGRPHFVEVAISTRFVRDDVFGVTLFLSDATGVLHSWDLPMGYGVYPIEAWRPGEVFRGRFGLGIPSSVPEGTYDLGFVVHDADGTVLPPREAPPGAEVDAPRLARGEVRFPALLSVTTADRIDALAEADVRAAIAAADADQCDLGEANWTRARRRRPWSDAWRDARRPDVGRALARCLIRAAVRAPDERLTLLERARGWDHLEPGVIEAAEALADGLFAQGEAARAVGDWDAAYRHFSDVLRVAPSSSWARRYAEEARDRRLGIYDAQGWRSSFGPW